MDILVSETNNKIFIEKKMTIIYSLCVISLNETKLCNCIDQNVVLYVSGTFGHAACSLSLSAS